MPEATTAAVPVGPPSPALEDLARRLIVRRKRFDISRIADITGLDRLGIAVVQAVRPEALSNAVAQGKGRNLAEAAVSAILEAAETFFAEQVDHRTAFEASAASLGQEAVEYATWLRPDAPADWHERKLPWTWGTDLASGRTNAVPLELVHTRFVVPPISSDGVFFASTSGLAAAPEKPLAIRHGLLELIERDAISRACKVHGFLHDARIDAGSIADAGVRDLLWAIAEGDFLVGLWAARGAGGVPVAWCQLLEAGERPVIMPYPSDGFAAHPEPAVAIRKAILEAAQSRLAAISGARDDITRAAYPRFPDWPAIAAARRLLKEGPRPVAFQQLCDDATVERAASLEGLLSVLTSAGIGRIVVVPVGHDLETDVHCVRMICPDLEPLFE